jgi:hypothetical protein
MKVFIIGILFFGLFGKTAICQNKFGGNEDIPQKVIARFDSLFPNASDIYWYSAPSKYPRTASFHCNCKEDYFLVVIDSNGNALLKQSNIPMALVHQKISEYLKNHYGKAFNDLVMEQIDNKGNITFTVSDEGIVCNHCQILQVHFNGEGNFISAEYVAGGI